MAHSGVGSFPHISGELFKRMAGVDLVGGPYRGQPEALANLLGGQVQVTFDPLSNSIGLVKQGKLRALAVTTAKVYSEKKTGANGDRAALQRMLKDAESGDVVVVTGLDRLARSTRDLLIPSTVSPRMGSASGACGRRRSTRRRRTAG
jgi:Resolvase, N terminal domain/Tripartite tricarboxylate transporter family receptor